MTVFDIIAFDSVSTHPFPVIQIPTSLCERLNDSFCYYPSPRAYDEVHAWVFLFW